MLVFWRNGYRGTSVDDLTEALNINRPSLYAAFGDKEKLFLESVDYYRDQFMVPAARVLLEAEDLREGLGSFFQAFLNLVLGKATPPGCFVACLLSEECCGSDAIRDKLAGLISGADRAFAKAFERHESVLRGTLTPEQAAKLLTSTIHGLAVRARSGAGRGEIMAVCNAFTNALLA
jgi:AcrR family transcriptional regulator